jgi:hypothetical protein
MSERVPRALPPFREDITEKLKGMTRDKIRKAAHA